MENGQIVEQGFVEDLKEKYILIKGDAADTEAAGKVLYSMTKIRTALRAYAWRKI